MTTNTFPPALNTSRPSRPSKVAVWLSPAGGAWWVLRAGKKKNLEPGFLGAPPQLPGGAVGSMVLGSSRRSHSWPDPAGPLLPPCRHHTHADPQVCLLPPAQNLTILPLPGVFRLTRGTGRSLEMLGLSTPGGWRPTSSPASSRFCNLHLIMGESGSLREIEWWASRFEVRLGFLG